MSDASVTKLLNAHYDANDATAFGQLLLLHPEHLRHNDGTDRWMWRAAIDGKLSLIQQLVQLGVDVNESKDKYVQEDPFCQVEGPVMFAAAEGHLETVQWLLD